MFLTEEQIEVILRELQKKMRVDKISKIEEKKIKTKNLLEWIAYKL